MRVRSLVVSALLLLSVAGIPGTGSAVSNPTVSTPPDGLRGHPLWDSWFDLGGYGYEEAEYFVSGTAETIAGTKPTAPYTTRIIVARPSNPADFNGTVMLDWTNVTAQFENAVDTILAQPMLLREGFAYVHVSAQAAGICCTPLTPKVWDPVRYLALSHPGDDYSFDIFSQIAQALRLQPALLGGAPVARIIAAGQSQSASRLYTYVSQVDAGAGVIDGFLIHGGGNKTFPGALTSPVLHLLSDAEAETAAPSADPLYRLWEIAGSSHSDFWLDYHQELGQGPRTVADVEQQPTEAYDEMNEIAGNYGEQVHPKQFTCIVGGSLFPMRHATSAAIHALSEWVRSGIAPAHGPRFAFVGGQLARDELGNALGGIRLPPIEHPVATYVSTSCELGGITIPMTDAQLNETYPTHAGYLCDMKDVADARVAEGFLLQDDADELMERVDAAKSRWVEHGIRTR